MAVVTESFDIPMDIMTKLATGEYRRIGGVVYHKIKSRQPEVVQNYHAALRDYIDDVRSGKLSMESINCLMDSLEELKQNNKCETKINQNV